MAGTTMTSAERTCAGAAQACALGMLTIGTGTAGVATAPTRAGGRCTWPGETVAGPFPVRTVQAPFHRATVGQQQQPTAAPVGPCKLLHGGD
ncbi:hypothetical protein [Streptomyces sp. NPDC059828]|uniref:hypothetical protein n=1 Tax=Streptomyces sp. NPDC059828 TaxID=3346965 RepID=UPI003658F970